MLDIFQNFWTFLKKIQVFLAKPLGLEVCKNLVLIVYPMKKLRLFYWECLITMIQTRLDDVQYAWNEISEVATEVLKEFQNCPRTDHWQSMGRAQQLWKTSRHGQWAHLLMIEIHLWYHRENKNNPLSTVQTLKIVWYKNCNIFLIN